MNEPRPQHVLLLIAPGSYRVEAFLAAASRLGIQASEMVDSPPLLAHTCELAADFRDPTALQIIKAFAHEHPLAAVIAVDDTGSLLAAQSSNTLGLPHNALHAALAARNKFVMRQMLAIGQVAIPQFALCDFDQNLIELAEQIAYPCVIKPLELNGSRGVMRANNPAEFVVCVQRLHAMIRRIYAEVSAPAILDGQIICDSARQFLVETFIPGVEVALEGLLDNGQLQVLALFDKPDPLDGPFFEETIYVTPSRLPEAVQDVIKACAAQAAAALGLQHGPMHAELRVNEDGPWLIEVAGRSIGGLCSQTLQFGTDASLEELILRQACGLSVASLGRSGQAGGVMMIPIPESGMLRQVTGIAEAQAVVGIESIEITAAINNPITALPEGESYLGFIFARGTTPAYVESSLRTAHAKLTFHIMPHIEL
jgi:biotin carboxylase